MRCKIVFQDNSWIIGRRVSFWDKVFLPETPGTHHWWVEECHGFDLGEQNMEKLINHKVRVAVPINSMKYMVFL
jgi:hypothetical protein